MEEIFFFGVKMVSHDKTKKSPKTKMSTYLPRFLWFNVRTLEWSKAWCSELLSLESITRKVHAATPWQIPASIYHLKDSMYCIAINKKMRKILNREVRGKQRPSHIGKQSFEHPLTARNWVVRKIGNQSSSISISLESSWREQAPIIIML